MDNVAKFTAFELISTLIRYNLSLFFKRIYIGGLNVSNLIKINLLLWSVLFITFSDPTRCFTMTAPRDVVDHSRLYDASYLLLSVTGVEADVNDIRGWSFEDYVKINFIKRWDSISAGGGIVFIQPDKPIYKPGQLGIAAYL